MYMFADAHIGMLHRHHHRSVAILASLATKISSQMVSGHATKMLVYGE